MNIGIIGAGALGGLFGGYMTDSGESVYLVDVWEDHIAEINENGLRIERDEATDLVTHPHATTDPASVPPVDIAFVFVKAIHTKEAIENAAGILREDTIIVTLQNGLGLIDEISRLVPENPVVGGPTFVAANVEGPGHIVQTGARGESKVGGTDSEAAKRVMEVLEEADFPAEAVDNPEVHIWNKQTLGLGAKAVAALTGLNTESQGESDAAVFAIESLIEEGVRVAEAKDIEITEDPIAKVHDIFEKHAGTETKSSMLEDVENERKTEVSYLNEKIVEYGDEENIDTPYNRLATALVKGKEYSYLHE